MKILIIILTIILIIILLGQRYNKQSIDKNINNDLLIDTSYNKVILDSIEYNIIKLDSTIVKLKIKYDDAIKKSHNISDSAAIELFKKLSVSE